MVITISIGVVAIAMIYAIVKGTRMALLLKKHGITKVELKQQNVSAKEMYNQLRKSS